MENKNIYSFVIYVNLVKELATSKTVIINFIYRIQHFQRNYVQSFFCYFL